MIRALAVAVAGVCALPLLLLGNPSPDNIDATAVSADVRAGGDDLAQLRAVPARLRLHLLGAARRWVLPPALLAALAQVSSGYDPRFAGPAEPGGPARGLMGLRPALWARFNLTQGATPQQPGPAAHAATRAQVLVHVRVR